MDIDPSLPDPAKSSESRRRSARIVSIIVNWNTCEYLRACVRSLTAAGADDSLTILCIDNASTDGSAEMLAREFPSVDLRRNGDNIGFARAVNQGIRIALDQYQADFVALVNSDVTVPASVLRALGDSLAEIPDAAAAAPALRHPDGRLQAGAAGHTPSAWSGICHFLFLSALTRGRCQGIFIRQEWHEGTATAVPVDWVSGACAVVSCAAIRRWGMLDERFFLYGEDIEWFCRMTAGGGAVRYIPWLTAQHWQGASSGSRDVRWLTALFGLVRARSGFVPAVLFQLAAAIGLAVRSLAHLGAGVVLWDASHRRRALQLGWYAAAALRAGRRR